MDDSDGAPGQTDASRADADPNSPDANANSADAMPAPDGGPVPLTESGQFARTDPCALGHDQSTLLLWSFRCNVSGLTSHTEAGAAGATISHPGETTDHLDIDFATSAFTLGTTLVAVGTMLVINGETGATEIYAVDKTGAAATSTLATDFGNSHVIGGALHNQRGTIFLVQDSSGGAGANIVAEINTVTGAVINSFSIAADFSVFYGEIDVCQSSGHLFLASSTESAIAEYTPDGVYIAEHSLPGTVAGVTGLAMEASGVAWVSDRAGNISKLTGMPCP